MAKHHPNNNPFREVKFVNPFITPSPSLKLNTCPSGHTNIIFNNGLDLIDAPLESENSLAMDIRETPTLEFKRRDSTNEHESLTFETPQVSCPVSKYT